MKRILKLVFIKIPLYYIFISVLYVIVLKYIPVWTTPLMWKRAVEYNGDSSYKPEKQWVPLSKISPAMIKCVIASEDNRFAEHHGFDWNELEKMKKEHEDKGKKIRGCSTISQQTAKNVFTFGTHSFFRKVFEAWHTVLIEAFWGKERIMEVYLNVVETGKGVYGVEAASQHYFDVPASRLTLGQSALIAASLPNPLHRNPAKPTKYMISRKNAIMSLTRQIAYPAWVMM